MLAGVAAGVGVDDAGVVAFAGAGVVTLSIVNNF